jgi:hypothetical protein
MAGRRPTRELRRPHAIFKKGPRSWCTIQNRVADETAEEIDQIGKDGLKTSEGTITKFDRAARTMTIKIADGTEETYRLTEHATEDAGKETEDTAKKSAHAIVYYSEEAGHKVAHYFKTS